MASSGMFARVALIAAVSVVLGVSTLSPLLKQGAPPDNRIAPAAFLPPSPGLDPAPPAATPAPRTNVAVSNLTMQEPPRAAPPAERPAAPSAPVRATSAEQPAAVAAVAPAAPRDSSPSTPCTDCPPAASAFPAMQPLTDEASAAAAQAAAQSEAPSSPPIVAATDDPPRKVEKRADRPKAKRTRTRTPFSYETQLAAH
jgi:hypothetical protein